MMDMLLSDSDCESLTESSGSEDQDDMDSMFGGQAQSILSSLEESIGKIDEFLSFERGFIHGDVVCSITDLSGQMGRVVDVDMVVDLENVYGEIIKDVNCKKLLKIRSFVVGDYVVHGPWLGRVDRVVDRVTILFDDGAKCEVTTVNPENVLPVSPILLDDTHYPYHLGQRVRVRPSAIFKSARWICGSWKENRYEGTVCGVEAGLVYVDWVASAMVGCNLSLPAPPCLQDSRNLTVLPCFPHANWQLGDWCMLPVDGQRGVMEHGFLNVATQGLIKGHKILEKGSKRGDHNSNVEEIYVIMKTKTKVDVLWQDGNHSIGLDSQSLFPVNSVGDHEFWPEQFVLEKGTYEDPHVSIGQRLGVVKSLDSKERTVKVKWKTLAMNRTNDTGAEYAEETVSAYELIEHPDYSFCLGDVVFRLEKNRCVVQTDGQTENHGDHAIKGMGMDSVQLSGDGVLKSKSFSGDHNEYPNKCYLSCIGNVTGFKDGGIEVRWASGLTSKVEPCEIVAIDKYEDSAASTVLHEDIEENFSQEMTEYDKQSFHLKGKDLSENTSNGVGEYCKKYPWESSAFFLPRAAIGFFTNIAASLFGSRGSTSSMTSSRIPEDENKFRSLHEKKVLENYDLSTEGRPLVVDDLETLIETTLKVPVEEAQENNELPYSSCSEKPGQFKQFDMVGDCTDHHFVDVTGKALMLSQVKRGWLKKVQQEWSILKKDLPDTIYVHVYEERIDLLRAAIVGAPGTPYHDGLFFFDFFLPPEYPHEPPLVHYHSGGLRVNPNLYESGKVCLSLLKTWTGTGTEVWNPGSSTILQVLLSLQALVLNEKPYFNEAGYDKQMGKAEGEKNSVTYNENAFLLSCRSMLYLLRKPPKSNHGWLVSKLMQHFEALVEEHFSRHGHSILLACKAYMEGALVGSPSVERETQKSNSMGFRIMLGKLFPKLISGFTDKGINCSEFLEPENDSVVKEASNCQST
ncbi:hypothetical protein HHK36_005342 [Tetracentron sinense]|uniref:E2 ubiquitin-conjugating enzyme n=1 Tax=Tetracentron sinense TaxID=13715 RepID=A0A834ZQ67_TETSI|nr:hypothetical protein HHK36_005342 [Tetracentron sinense]